MGSGRKVFVKCRQGEGRGWPSALDAGGVTALLVPRLRVAIAFLVLLGLLYFPHEVKHFCLFAALCLEPSSAWHSLGIQFRFVN